MPGIEAGLPYKLPGEPQESGDSTIGSDFSRSGGAEGKLFSVLALWLVLICLSSPLCTAASEPPLSA